MLLFVHTLSLRELLSRRKSSLSLSRCVRSRLLHEFISYCAVLILGVLIPCVVQSIILMKRKGFTFKVIAVIEPHFRIVYVKKSMVTLTITIK